MFKIELEIRDKLFITFVINYLNQSFSTLPFELPDYTIKIISDGATSNTKNEEFLYNISDQNVLTIYDYDISNITSYTTVYESMNFLLQRILNLMYKVVYPYFSNNDFDSQWNLFERVTYKFIMGVSKPHNVALAAFKLDYLKHLPIDKLKFDYDKSLKSDKVYLTFSGDTPKRYFDFKNEYSNIFYDEETNETLNNIIDALDVNSSKEHPLTNFLDYSPNFDFSKYSITDSSYYNNQILERYSVPIYIVDYIDNQFKSILDTEYFSLNNLYILVRSLADTDFSKSNNLKEILDERTTRRNRNLIYPKKINSSMTLKFREVLIITSFTLLKQHPYFKIINLSNALSEKNKKNTFDYNKFAETYTNFFSIIKDLIPFITHEMNVSPNKEAEFEKYAFYVLSTAFSYQNIYNHYTFMNYFSKLHQNFTSIFADTKYMNHFIDYESMEQSFTCVYNEWIQKLDETFKHVDLNNHSITIPSEETLNKIISTSIEQHTITNDSVLDGIKPLKDINQFITRLDIFESLEKNIHHQFLRKSKHPMIYNKINE
ncbi:hypothetical protein [Macrococcoides bohemicum]|uniref:hypothetical protein n=1 Tax=Macrococcoides bohemicum TaxID=1903056 RepID=UPI0028AA213B|nr:hypothetical protein [Macrococcus bohemicus]